MEKIIIRSKEAAEMLGTSPNVVLELLESGKIPAYREGKNWSIPVESVKKYAEDRAEKEAAERRKKCLIG